MVALALAGAGAARRTPAAARVAVPPAAEAALRRAGRSEAQPLGAPPRRHRRLPPYSGPGGAIRGVQADRRFPSASGVKAMLTLAVVREARDRRLTAGERALVGPMITVSNNNAGILPPRRRAAGLYSVARAAPHHRASQEHGRLGQRADHRGRCG